MPVPANSFHISVLAVIGVGLIGGSLALALKRSNAVGKVIGYGRARENLDKAKALGVIDEIAPDALTATKQANIVFLAIPVGAMKAILTEIQSGIGPDTIISDAGSVKTGIVSDAEGVLGDLFPRFVPAHPIAGKEHSGVEAASEDLYDQHKVAITPHHRTDPLATRTVVEMWQIAGAEVVSLGVEEHDRVLALTSHLPHILSYAMVDYFTSSTDLAKCYQMAGGGFYDFTRTASSDPVMWRDISSMNKSELLSSISGYQRTLEKLAEMIKQGDTGNLELIFRSASAARAKVTEKRLPKNGGK